MKIDNKLFDEIFDESDNNSIEKKLVDSKKSDICKVELNNSTVATCIFDWVSSILVAVIAVVILLTFCFRLIDVDGTSMETTLIDTDKVIVTDLFYTPENGDIVVISHGAEYDKPLVKRVIATEGQTLDINFDENKVYVDGKVVDEPYIQGVTVRGNAEIPKVIPEGKVFVMGDNRPVSMDSRHHEVGLIDVDNIIGKAQLVIIPHTKENNGSLPVLDFSQIRYLY